MPTMKDDETLPPVVMPTCEVRKVLQGQKALVTGANSGIAGRWRWRWAGQGRTWW